MILPAPILLLPPVVMTFLERYEQSVVQNVHKCVPKSNLRLFVFYHNTYVLLKFYVFVDLSLTPAFHTTCNG